MEEAAKELGYDFSGVDAPKNDKDFYGLRYAEFVVPLVKAMQEQQEQIEEKDETIEANTEKIASLVEENAEIKEENIAIREENTEMKARMDRMEAMLEQFGSSMESCCNGASNKLESPFQKDEPSLKQNIPNPFTRSTIIPYYIPQHAQRASLHFFNETGIEITQRALQGTGDGQILLTGEQLPAGIYFYSLQVDGKNIATKRMVVLR
ncbi:MAG TPA: T9SS type A sorting domain-containing protein [Flavobacteriales bacterium]|nr:T9SS type A sorting domain-containing protein [Flavobacteriales bacterium]